MRSLRSPGYDGYFRPTGRRRLWGVGLGSLGGLLVIKVLPLWIWPFGIGLWLLWAGLGPLVVGAGLLWIGWRLLAR